MGGGSRVRFQGALRSLGVKRPSDRQSPRSISGTQPAAYLTELLPLNLPAEVRPYAENAPCLGMPGFPGPTPGLEMIDHPLQELSTAIPVSECQISLRCCEVASGRFAGLSCGNFNLSVQERIYAVRIFWSIDQ